MQAIPHDFQAPSALVIRATDPETGIELATYSWLNSLAEAIQMELDGYDEGDGDKQDRAIFLQKKLIDKRGMPPLSQRDMEIFIPRLVNGGVKEIMQTLCVNRRAIEEARARYEEAIAQILQSDGHIIQKMLHWSKNRDTFDWTQISSELPKKKVKVRRDTANIVGYPYPLDQLVA